MKLSPSVLAFAGLVGSSAAFAPTTGPKAFVTSGQRNVARFMAEDPLPFFASGAKTEEPAAAVEDDVDDVESEIQEELKKTKRMSNLRNANGVDYAPWMNMSAEDEENIRKIAEDRAEARRKRKLQESQVSGNLYYDSQAQELSGTGLNYKIIGGEVELEWATKSEADTKGFIVKRRPAKTTDFVTIASFEDWGPLVSQGSDGGVYRYLDETAEAGGWVYRISECDTSGQEADLCQCLVEVQTEEEQRGAVIAGVGFAALAIVALVAGVMLDPMNGY